MKHPLLTTIAAVVLVGCGESQQSVRQAEAKPEPLTAKEPNISILEAVAAGNIAVVKQHLADKTYHENYFEYQRLLDVAVLEGHKEITELLISKGADVNAKDKVGLGRTPLIEAIHGNQIDLIELLIAKEADVNLHYGHETPLDLGKGNKEIYDLLRKHGGKTSEELEAPEPSNVLIHRAVVNGNIEVVKQHLAAGTNVDVKGMGGRTPVFFSAYWGHKEINELLIVKGADVNAKSYNGMTALHEAHNKEIAELLIAAGADVNAKSESGLFRGDTPLDQAEPFEDDSPEDKANKKEIADLLRKNGGKTGEELKAEATK